MIPIALHIVLKNANMYYAFLVNITNIIYLYLYL